jgi:hypothetical protein
MPAFGDYGVAAPAWLEGFDPKKMDYAAKLVYTRPDDWLVVRGHSVKNQGNAQFRELAKKLTSDPTFQGKDHCWGDEYALARAAGGSPGVAMTWIRAATRHHLAVVDAQLSSLP